MCSKQQDLESQRKTVIDLNNNLAALEKLKQNAITVECKQLQDTVDNINRCLEDILPMFFDEPIDVKLQLYKTTKSTKKIKPGLNILIKYKNAIYDKIDQPSGGEGDRISLAVILALNQLSNSPIIMLDECISSLDAKLKESCLNSIKLLRNKIIICVDHEAVEGYYDKTIEVIP